MVAMNFLVLRPTNTQSLRTSSCYLEFVDFSFMNPCLIETVFEKNINTNKIKIIYEIVYHNDVNYSSIKFPGDTPKGGPIPNYIN